MKYHCIRNKNVQKTHSIIHDSDGLSVTMGILTRIRSRPRPGERVLIWASTTDPSLNIGHWHVIITIISGS